jgi:histone acetyltransferase (RNA polymerase elongator complex component)
MVRRNRIFPIFLPHAGCPFHCVYCNQLLVSQRPHSGKDIATHFQEVLHERVESALAGGTPGEIAFFGGTFTSLPKELIVRILEVSSGLVIKGVFSGIRFSTRPDSISEQTCALLREYPIQTVELGVQSLSNEVLASSRRGYAAADVRRAAGLVHANSWNLGIQLMPGLPGDTRDRFLASVEEAVDLKPRFVRIYPTLVLEKTVLATWYRRGMFTPLSLDEAVSWCSEAYDLLARGGIALARAGLHSDPQLEKPGSIVAGPYHQAFGYLVRVHWWRERVDGLVISNGMETKGRNLTVWVPHHRVSEAVGPSRANLQHWKTHWSFNETTVRGMAGEGEHYLKIVLE